MRMLLQTLYKQSSQNNSSQKRFFYFFLFFFYLKIKEAKRLTIALAFSVSILWIWKRWSSPSTSNNSTSPFHPLFLTISKYQIPLSLNWSFPTTHTSILLHPSPRKLGAPVPSGLTTGLSIPPVAEGYTKFQTKHCRLLLCPSLDSDPIGLELQK